MEALTVDAMINYSKRPTDYTLSRPLPVAKHAPPMRWQQKPSEAPAPEPMSIGESKARQRSFRFSPHFYHRVSPTSPDTCLLPETVLIYCSGTALRRGDTLHSDRLS